METSYGGIDYALLGGFFISYSVFGLVQLGFLFGRRYLLLVSFVVIQGLILQMLQRADYSRLCDLSKSALICDSSGYGIAALAGFWVYVLIAAVGLFVLSSSISAITLKLKRR